jgi:hypothetical protein
MVTHKMKDREGKEIPDNGGVRIWLRHLSHTGN